MPVLVSRLTAEGRCRDVVCGSFEFKDVELSPRQAASEGGRSDERTSLIEAPATQKNKRGGHAQDAPLHVTWTAQHHVY